VALGGDLGSDEVVGLVDALSRVEVELAGLGLDADLAVQMSVEEDGAAILALPYWPCWNPETVAPSEM
jgi:hypothetical protein